MGEGMGAQNEPHSTVQAQWDGACLCLRLHQDNRKPLLPTMSLSDRHTTLGEGTRAWVEPSVPQVSRDS